MKKPILPLILSVILVLTVPVLAFDPLKDIKIGGELRVRGLSTNNFTDWKDTAKDGRDDDLDNHVATKTEIELDMNITEDVTGIVLFEHDPERKWAMNGIHNIEQVEGDIEIRRAYLKVKDVAELANLTVGRQEYGKEYQEWIVYMDMLDAVKVETNLGLVDIVALGAKIHETDVTRNTDTDLYGLNVSSSKILPGNRIYGYFYNRIENRSAEDAIGRNMILGAKLEGEIPIASKVNYLAEIALQRGDEVGVAGRDLQGMGFRISGGYETNIADIGDIDVSIGYIYGSGDDADTRDKNEAFRGISPVFSVIPIDKIEYTTIVHDRISDSVENKSIIVANADFTPTFFNKLTLGLTWATYKWNEIAPRAEDDIGREIDLTATYTHSDKVSLGLMYGIFSPGDAIVIDGDPASKFMTELKIVF